MINYLSLLVSFPDEASTSQSPQWWLFQVCNLLCICFQSIPRKQSFLSCITFGVDEVIHVACQLHSWFAYETEKPLERLHKMLKVMQERNLCSQSSTLGSSLNVPELQLILNSTPEKYLKNLMERVLEIVAHPTQILNNNF